MPEYDRLRVHRFDFAQPIHTTVDKNSVRYAEASMHSVNGRPHVDFAAGAEEHQFQRTHGGLTFDGITAGWKCKPELEAS